MGISLLAVMGITLLTPGAGMNEPDVSKNTALTWLNCGKIDPPQMVHRSTKSVMRQSKNRLLLLFCFLYKYSFGLNKVCKNYYVLYNKNNKRWWCFDLRNDTYISPNSYIRCHFFNH